MASWEILIWVVVVVLSAVGFCFILYGLKKCGIGRATESANHERDITEHANSMVKKINEYRRLLQVLANKKKQLEKSSDVDNLSADSDDLFWQIYDLEWRMDDLNWSIDDINWDIRDAKFEFDWRKEQEKTTKATFWTVCGAAIISIAGLGFSIYCFFV